MVFWIYRLCFLPIYILFIPKYLKHALKRGGYLKDFKHRLGFCPVLHKPNNKKAYRIWIHAVSVGEVKALLPLLRHLSLNKQIKVVLSTHTSTAYSIAHNLYTGYTECICLFPIDFWLFSHLAWNRLKPDLALLMEQEIWPEHLYQAFKRHVPVGLINARLSNRSFKKHKKFNFLLKPILEKISLIFPSSNEDFKRFEKLGIPRNKLLACGNLKCDFPVNYSLKETQKKETLHSMGFIESLTQPTPLIILGSSTWAMEEQLLIKILNAAIKEGIDCRLLIVPRHVERRKELLLLLENQQLPFHVRSFTNRPFSTQCKIYLADTTGELTELAKLADMAFIGKSLPPHVGGQSPIEAAGLGLPIVYGPSMSNFSSICESLENEMAALRGANADEVFDLLLMLIKDPTKRFQLGRNAKNWHNKNKGAAICIYEHLLNLFPSYKNNE